MAKLAQSTIKYLIEADFIASGAVEKPDVIGAIFGQTEGLLGQELDLRELQRTGRIGRIEVNLKISKGKTTGKILIPSSLDGSETSLVAAAIETIERIGPCTSQIKLKSVKDVRALKRDYVVSRAKTILSKLVEEEMPITSDLTKNLKNSVRVAEITKYKGLSAGGDVLTSDEIILVEGRADVLVLLKHGIKNALAIGGTAIPQQVLELTKKKTSTVFLDGDRGGDLILKEILQLTNIDFVARAPAGKEVEDLTQKEIFKSLREKVPINRASKQLMRASETDEIKKEIKKDLDVKIKNKISEALDKMVGTRAAYIFDEKMKLQAKIPLNRFDEKNEKLKNAKIVVLDGTINNDMVRIAEKSNVEFLAGKKAQKKYTPKSLVVYTKNNLEG